MINILVTLNANYVPPLKVLLKSLFINNPGEQFTIYLMHSGLPKEMINDLYFYIEDQHDQQFSPITVEPGFFRDAPVFRHYTTEMYYRLSAHHFLPESVDRILYLDPDIVCINPVKELYNQSFDGNMFIAAEHEHTTKYVRPLNKIRLKTPHATKYFNTGVLLMNIPLMRKYVHLEDIYDFIEENKRLLSLPDQDILNALYWDKIKAVDSYTYNYDARHFELARLYRPNKITMEWIEENTVFIHYCGKDKPWHDDYKGKLGKWYRKYEQMVKEQRFGEMKNER